MLIRFEFESLLMDDRQETATAYLLLYVDDIVLTASSKSLKYVVKILDRAHMANCNPSQTPIDTESKLGSDSDSVFDLTLYQSCSELCDMLDYGLQLFSSFTTDLVAYSDRDWGGCPTTRHSTLGYYVFHGNNLLSWSSVGIKSHLNAVEVTVAHA
nr:hypothetical protein [Tanacetum cinerariifolium]